MNAAIRSIPLLALLLFASQASASLVERRATSFPQSNVVTAGPGRVTGGGTGKFLVYGQRISGDGTRLDSEPVIGAEGFAVGWPDGWLTIDQRAEAIEINHLGDAGGPVRKISIASRRQFLDAASNGGQLAILEYGCDQFACTLWITVTDGKSLLRREPVAPAMTTLTAKIAPFLDGFLVAACVRPDASAGASSIELLRLGPDGAPGPHRSFGLGEQIYPSLSLAPDGDVALLTIVDSFHSSASVVNSALATSPAYSLGGGPGIDVSALAFTTPGGFLVAYNLDSYAPRVSKHRAAILDRAGNVLGDVESEPIASGDRAGSRYLVMRPWGDAAIAEGDPRAIVTPAFPILRREWKHPNSIETVVSGDVTLVVPDSYPESGFVRVNRDGSPIDAEPRALPSRSIVATPDGFAFISIEEGAIRMRRLSRRGDWIDPASIELAVEPRALAVSAHCGERDMLVAWTTDSDIIWSRFALDGAPLQAIPSRLTPTWFGPEYLIGVAGANGRRLLVLQESWQCSISPCVVPLLVAHTLAIDEEGAALGTLQTFDSSATSPKALGLADGTWILPAPHDRLNVLHLAADGALLASTTIPELEYLADITTTPSGWRAICDDYVGRARMVEIDGADHVAGTIGLSDVLQPRFAASGRIAYIAESPELEGFMTTWTARFEERGIADLSIRLRLLATNGPERILEVAIRNAGPQASSSSRIYTNGATRFLSEESGRFEVGPLLPGETRFVTATSPYGQTWERLRVQSDDTLDPDFSNDVASPMDASVAQPGRHRPIRLGN